MRSGFVITIPTTREADDHTEYGIVCNIHDPNLVTITDVAAGTRQPIVWRRYQDFESLRNSLIQNCPSFLLPDLPAKHSWWSSRSEQIVNERQQQLEMFLRELEAVLERSGQTWDTFRNFVGITPSVLATMDRPVPVDRLDKLKNVIPVPLRENEVVKLQIQISVLEDEKSKLQLASVTNDKEVSSLRKKQIDMKQLKDHTSQMEEEKSRLVVEVARLEALSEVAIDTENEIGSLKEDNARLKSEFSLLEGERSDLKAAIVRHNALVDSLRREVARIEHEEKNMQLEIATLQETLTSNPNEEVLSNEVLELKKENGVLRLEIARLETTQKSAASYSASILAKFETLEKESTRLQNEAKAAVETESKVASHHLERIEQLENELKITKCANATLRKETETESKKTQASIAANLMLERSMESEANELQTLGGQMELLQEHLANAFSEYNVAKVKSRSGEGELPEMLNKTLVEYKTEPEKNLNINMKLSTKTDTLVTEGLSVEETNMSLERKSPS